MQIGIGSPLDFRPATLGDFEFAHELTRSNMEAYVVRHFGGWSRDIFTENYRKGRNYILRISDLRMGYVRLVTKPPTLLLDDFQIAPSHQRRGFGAQVLAHLNALLPELACTAIRLRVYDENPARRLYLREGFREVERLEGMSYLQREIQSPHGSKIASPFSR